MNSAAKSTSSAKIDDGVSADDLIMFDYGCLLATHFASLVVIAALLIKFIVVLIKIYVRNTRTFTLLMRTHYTQSNYLSLFKKGEHIY